MKLIATDLEGAFIVEQPLFQDSRGSFQEIFSQKAFEGCGILARFVQDNCSYSNAAGVIRGLHLQFPPHAQAKLVWVVTGSIYDVIVDLRPDSPSFLRWTALELSADSPRILFIPKGFAHGFCTLVPDTRVFYKVDCPYAPQAEGGVRYDDPDLAIDWPTASPILSDKDRALPFLKDLGFNR
jgi:dTDP-4-dehydrorhamnose 3,5-epimerase